MLPGTGRGNRRLEGGDPGADASHPEDSKLKPVPEAEVRAELERVLASTSFRYSERLRGFLKFVVEEELAGNGSQLKESVLAVELFDRDASYDSRADSVVRVEARRLREKLQKYYEAEGREDTVRITMPKGNYAPVFSRGGESAPVPVQDKTEVVPPERRPWHASLVVLGAVAVTSVVATVFLVRWMAPRQDRVTPAHRRITADPGLTFQPALSNDGTLLAYSSDRSGTGHLDVWVQQVAGGLPVRLTSSPGDDVEPAFSPDGTVIAYRAEVEADGVYVMPALGGTSTLLARGGYRPRFSPDGTRVAYWTGERSFELAKIFVAPATGGSSSAIQPEFEYAAYPVWSPDGKHIAFVGSKKLTNHWDFSADDWDWWVAPVEGGPAIRMNARRIFRELQLRPPMTGWSHRRILPYSWTSTGHILFAGRTGGKTNIWQLPVNSRTFQIDGRAEQLTFGTGWEDDPTVAADGTLAYSVLTYKADVWSLPVNADSAATSGPMVRLTSDAADYIRPVVSQSGEQVAFISNRTGNYDVWARDLKTGREAPLTQTRQDESSPAISLDGTRVAYGYGPPLKETIFVVPFGGGGAAQICADCGEPRAWLPGNAGLLFQRVLAAGESLIGRLDMAGHETVFLRSRESTLFSPSVSRDGRWLALIVRTPPNDHRIAAIPLRDQAAAPKEEWVTVTGSTWVDKPRWSPSGNVIYYVAARDGFVCLWASKLDATTKRPIGEPKPIEHFHGRRNALGSVYGLELSAASDKLIFNLGEDFGNVWLAPASR